MTAMLRLQPLGFAPVPLPAPRRPLRAGVAGCSFFMRPPAPSSGGGGKVPRIYDHMYVHVHVHINVHVIRVMTLDNA